MGAEVTPHECSQTVYVSFGIGGHRRQCQLNAKIRHKNQWWCWKHDPKAVAVQRAENDQEWNDRWKESEIIDREGQRLARRLGCKGEAYYDTQARVTMKRLVISFEDAARLADKLKVYEEVRQHK